MKMDSLRSGDELGTVANRGAEGPKMDLSGPTGVHTAVRYCFPE